MREMWIREKLKLNTHNIIHDGGGDIKLFHRLATPERIAMLKILFFTQYIKLSKRDTKIQTDLDKKRSREEQIIRTEDDIHKSIEKNRKIIHCIQ